MKLFKCLLVVLLFSSIMACNGDNLGEVSPELLGDWKLTEVTCSGTSTTTVLGISEDTQFTGEGVNMTLEISFAENGDFTTRGDYDFLLTRVVLGQDITNTWDGPFFISNGEWGKEANRLNVMTSDGEESATIVSMDDSTMVLDWSFQDVNNLTNTTRAVDGTFTFTKQ